MTRNTYVYLIAISILPPVLVDIKVVGFDVLYQDRINYILLLVISVFMPVCQNYRTFILAVLG